VLLNGGGSLQTSSFFFFKENLPVYGLMLCNKQAEEQDLLMDVSLYFVKRKRLKMQGLIKCIHHPDTFRDHNKQLKMDRVSLEKQYLLGRKAV
jgi:hypothetical protein